MVVLCYQVFSCFLLNLDIIFTTGGTTKPCLYPKPTSCTSVHTLSPASHFI